MAAKVIHSGFTPDTHIFLSWFSESDVHTLGKAMQGQNDPIVEKTQDFNNIHTRWGFNILRPINVGYILRQLTDLEHADLKWVH